MRTSGFQGPMQMSDHFKCDRIRYITHRHGRTVTWTFEGGRFAGGTYTGNGKADLNMREVWPRFVPMGLVMINQARREEITAIGVM